MRQKKKWKRKKKKHSYRGKQTLLKARWNLAICSRGNCSKMQFICVPSQITNCTLNYTNDPLGACHAHLDVCVCVGHFVIILKGYRRMLLKRHAIAYFFGQRSAFYGIIISNSQFTCIVTAIYCFLCVCVIAILLLQIQRTRLICWQHVWISRWPRCTRKMQFLPIAYLVNYPLYYMHLCVCLYVCVCVYALLLHFQLHFSSSASI